MKKIRFIPKVLKSNSLIAFSIAIILVLGCNLSNPTSKSFKTVRHGCITNDGSKIALDGFDEQSLFQESDPNDGYRLILDGTTGKIVWKDLTSFDRLVCSEDNSIISVSIKGAKWIESGKTLQFSRQGEPRYTDFIGMTDSETFVRVERQYTHERLRGDNKGRTSSQKSYSEFPTFLIDKINHAETKTIKLTQTDLPGVAHETSFVYFFEKDRIIFAANDKIYGVDIKSGKTSVAYDSFAEFEKTKESKDKYDAIDTTGYGGDGFIEIYEGKGEGKTLVNKISERDLNAKVIHIIDCCNNQLNLLYWERETYIKVSKINFQNGQIIWTSENLIDYSK